MSVRTDLKKYIKVTIKYWVRCDRNNKSCTGTRSAKPLIIEKAFVSDPK